MPVGKVYSVALPLKASSAGLDTCRSPVKAVGRRLVDREHDVGGVEAIVVDPVVGSPDVLKAGGRDAPAFHREGGIIVWVTRSPREVAARDIQLDDMARRENMQHLTEIDRELIHFPRNERLWRGRRIAVGRPDYAVLNQIGFPVRRAIGSVEINQLRHKIGVVAVRGTVEDHLHVSGNRHLLRQHIARVGEDIGTISPRRGLVRRALPDREVPAAKGGHGVERIISVAQEIEIFLRQVPAELLIASKIVELALCVRERPLVRVPPVPLGLADDVRIGSFAGPAVGPVAVPGAVRVLWITFGRDVIVLRVVIDG